MDDENTKPTVLRSVGRNNPPVEHQFQPGTSGNANGRPPGSLGIKATLRKALEADGGDGKSVLTTLVDRMVRDAVAGDQKMATQIVTLALKLDPEG